LVYSLFIHNTANARYQCDYFVHYYNLTQEIAGRSGIGGYLNPHEIRLLSQAVHCNANTNNRTTRNTVQYKVDEEADFWNKYAALLQRIHTTKDPQGKYVYYPWKARTYKVSTICMDYNSWAFLVVFSVMRFLYFVFVPYPTIPSFLCRNSLHAVPTYIPPHMYLVSSDRGQYCENVAQY
jgi:hypothetical protein